MGKPARKGDDAQDNCNYCCGGFAHAKLIPNLTPEETFVGASVEIALFDFAEKWFITTFCGLATPGWVNVSGAQLVQESAGRCTPYIKL